MPHAGFIVDDQPVRPVPHVARPDLAEEPAPYLGMDAVGADQEIRLEDLAAPGFRAHAIGQDVDAPNADVEPYCRGRQAAVQHVEQMRAVHERADRQLPGLVERAVIAHRERAAARVAGLAH